MHVRWIVFGVPLLLGCKPPSVGEEPTDAPAVAEAREEAAQDEPEDPYLADPPQDVHPLREASLDELIARANAIPGIMVDTFGQETNLLPNDAEKRAVLLLVLSMAEADHETFVSLVPEDGVEVGRAVLVKDRFEFVREETKRVDRAAVANALEQPGSLGVFPQPGYLGLLPAALGDPSKASWTLNRDDDGLIELVNDQTQSAARFKAGPDGNVWLRAVYFFTLDE